MDDASHNNSSHKTAQHSAALRNTTSRHYFRAELLRSRWTFTMWLPAVMSAIAAVLALLSTGVEASRLASAHLYGAVLLAPLAALTGVVGQLREERYRQGGTAWRNVSPLRVLSARAGVVGIYVLLGHAFMAAILAADIIKAVQFALVSSVVFLVFWALGIAVWRFLPCAALLVTPLIAIAWCVASILSLNEDTIAGPSWLLMPWTWAFRPTLPIYGVLPNSVVAPADSAIWDIAIVPPTLLHAALGGVFFALALVPARVRSPRTHIRRQGRVPEQPQPRTHTQITAGQTLARTPAATTLPAARTTTSATDYRMITPLPIRRASLSKGLALTLPWRTWCGLAVLMLVALGALRARYGVETATAALSFLCVPTAVSVVGVMTWTAQHQAWPALMYRRARNKILARLFLLAMLFLVPVLLLGVALSGAGAGAVIANGYRWIYQAMVLPFVAAMILAIVSAVARRSVPGAIFLSIALAAWSILIGGDVLNSGPLWWTSAWSWTWTVRDYPERWVAIVLVSTIIAVVVMVLNNRLLRLKK